jgi:hypothetical protein
MLFSDSLLASQELIGAALTLMGAGRNSHATAIYRFIITAIMSVFTTRDPND